MSEVAKTYKSDLDRESLLGVRERYDSMQQLIGQLSRKVSNVATNSENEFLAAYRVHMLSVQTELKNLNEQVAKAEEQLNDDGNVAKLEHEVSWFRDETFRLKTNTESMRKDLQAMVSTLRDLQEQKEFLNDQLKSVMKRSRVLESELEFSISEQSVVELGSVRSKQNTRDYTPDRIESRTNIMTISDGASKSKLVKSKKISKSLPPGQLSVIQSTDSLISAKKAKGNNPIKHMTYSQSLENFLQSR